MAAERIIWTGRELVPLGFLEVWQAVPKTSGRSGEHGILNDFCAYL